MRTLLDTLDWPAIEAQLQAACQTPYGLSATRFEKMHHINWQACQAELNAVDETKRRIQRYSLPQLPECKPVRDIVERLSKQGVLETPQAAADLLRTLAAARSICRFFDIPHDEQSTYPELTRITQAWQFPSNAFEALEATLSPEGEIRDEASSALYKIRQGAHTLQTRLQQLLQQLIHNSEITPMLQEPIYTLRDGRYVLPVRAEHKQHVPGVVLDTSASGQTLFIEPTRVAKANAQRLALQAEMDQEVRRILIALSQTLQPEAAALFDVLNILETGDCLLAKAQLSLKMKAEPLTWLEHPGTIALKDARHPLLIGQLADVIPNDIDLAPPAQTVVITGPNTGGKTVLLKLLGLICLMAQCGLHVPCKAGSQMSWFEAVLVDLGDPQSLTQNLSTFSGHLTQLRDFFAHPKLGNSLVLIDEICAGTDPEEGAALATALLDRFHQSGATTWATTHLGQLKLLAHQRDGFVNASVLFDASTLQPTYRLVMGAPGSSHAFTIAAHYGLPETVIAQARQHISAPTADTSRLIESLETQNRHVAESLAEIERLRKELADEEAQLAARLNQLEGEKRQKLAAFQQQLLDKLQPVEADVQALKDKLSLKRRHHPKAIEQMGRKLKQLRDTAGQVVQDTQAQLYPNPGIAWDALAIGDVVESRSLSLKGTIIEKHEAKQSVTLQAGNLKTIVPLSDLISRKQAPAPSTQKPRGKVVLQQERRYQESCDVRGLTVEEALAHLDKFLDDAMVVGQQHIGVIHGLGTGALKQAVRKHLLGLPYVKSVKPAPAMDGGDGKTLVDLKG